MGRFLLAFLGLVMCRAPVLGDGPANPYALLAEEQQLVRRLADQALQDRKLNQGRLYLTRLEVFRDSRATKFERNVLAAYYRYEGDLTILVGINLGRREVTKVEAVPHLPTSLAPEEWTRAEKLAREHPTVHKALARFGSPEKIEVDSLVHLTVDETSPFYQHRVVRLLFRQGRTYLLYGPTVFVDLTTETVQVEINDDGHK